ncbi:MAG: hypothetical protein QOF69_751 [Solirubrobacteraceae bacterium]|nr:hypothetical protein [Solirubrobacteraceae bacterium]
MSTVTSDRGGRGEATTSAELEPIAHPLAVAPAAPALPAGLLDDACRHVRRKALSTWLGCQLPSVLASFRTADAHATTSAAAARMRRRSRLEAFSGRSVVGCGLCWLGVARATLDAVYRHGTITPPRDLSGSENQGGDQPRSRTQHRPGPNQATAGIARTECCLSDHGDNRLPV